jgi:hypothetical protein
MDSAKNLRQIGALGLIALTLQATGLGAMAQAAAAPKLMVVPLSRGEGATEQAAAVFSSLVMDALKAQQSGPQLVEPPKAGGGKGALEAGALIAEGRKAVIDLKFDEGLKALSKGLEQLQADPSGELSSIYDAYVYTAVAHFRTGEDKKAQKALEAVARLSPTFKLPEGKFPPVFVRELEKARVRVEKQPKQTLTVEGPMGATAFINGRDLGMVPVDETLPVGTHFVKVEGTKGERFGQTVELKGAPVKVKAAFDSQAVAGPSELKIAPLLTAEVVQKVEKQAKASAADFVLLGLVYRTSERQLTAVAALYSVKKQGFLPLEPRTFDTAVEAAEVEALRLAEEAVKKVFSTPAPVALPYNLTSAKRVTVADATEPSTRTRQAVKPSLIPSGGVERPLEPVEPPPQVDKGGTPAWVWVVVGVGVAAAAGGTYYGVTQANRPVTGEVRVTWP